MRIRREAQARSQGGSSRNPPVSAAPSSHLEMGIRNHTARLRPGYTGTIWVIRKSIRETPADLIVRPPSCLLIPSLTPRASG